MKTKLKSKLNFLILILLTFVVLYFSLKDDFNTTIHTILQINIFWFIIAILFVFIFWSFRTIPLYTFVHKFQKQYTFKKAFRLTLSTQFFNAITPFATGGQPFQVYYLKKNGIKISDGTNIIIQNFIVYQIALIILGILAILLNANFHFFQNNELLRKLVIIGFIMNSLVTIGLFTVAFLEKWNKFIITKGIILLTKLKIVKKPEEKTQEWKEYIHNFHTGAKTLIQDKKLFLTMIGSNVLALIFEYSIPFILLLGMGDYTSYNMLEAIVTSAYVMLLGSFVPMPGGTGGLEYGFITFYGNFITGTTLSAIMLLWRFITYYFGMFIGAIAVNIHERN